MNSSCGPEYPSEMFYSRSDDGAYVVCKCFIPVVLVRKEGIKFEESGARGLTRSRSARVLLLDPSLEALLSSP